MAKAKLRRALSSPKAKAPQDLTDYSLRGIRRTLARLGARVTALEAIAQAPADEPSDGPITEDGAAPRQADEG